jgi:uncharacterized protein
MSDPRIPGQWTMPTAPSDAIERVTSFLRAVYGWMCVGLGLTALVAFQVANTPAILNRLMSNQLLFVGLILAELGLVFFLSARVTRVAAETAVALFVLYAALNGVTLSLVVLAYTGQSVADTFAISAGMFGAMALFGSTTKRSLAGVGQFMYMGLVGLVLASLVGLFWHSGALQFLISGVGVLVFTGLAAWDAQRLKQMALAAPEGQARSLAIVGALSLYLDFINLFLSLLSFVGNRRE